MGGFGSGRPGGSGRNTVEASRSIDVNRLHLSYSKRIGMERIAEEGYNLNISRYISTAEQEIAIDLTATHDELIEIEKQVRESTAKHNAFLKELGLSPLPGSDQ